MSWKDKLRPASFRNARFFVDVAEQAGGRRAPVTEYPFSKVAAFAEDIGLKARKFQIEGYVIGPDYMAARDQLLNFLEMQGPGELIHPYYGSRRVQALDYRVRESASDGGMATFSMNFVETPTKASRPSLLANATETAKTSVQSAQAAAYASFTSSYNVTRQPEWAFEAVGNALASATTAIRKAVLGFASNAQNVGAFQAQCDQLISSGISLATDPNKILAAITNLATTIGTLPLSTAGLNALIRSYGFTTKDRPPFTTPTRKRQQGNFDAVTGIMRQVIVIQATNIALNTTFDSYETAVKFRGWILRNLDSEILNTKDDSLYSALTQMRADLCKAIPGTQSLPHLIKYTALVTLPSLVLSYMLYGNTSKEQDLVTRNKIKHPGFIPPNTQLEVLSDVSGNGNT